LALHSLCRSLPAGSAFSHAALILSLESVFAVIGGWLILHEGLSIRGIIGCALMLTGMLLSRSKKIAIQKAKIPER